MASNTKKISSNKKWGRFKLPSSFVIIFVIIVILTFMTWIPGLAKNKMGIVDIFVVPWKGLTKSIALIGFIISIGAFLNITVKTQALESSLQKLVKKMKGKEILLIPICMTLFSIGGTTFGMAEETIVFYPILIPIFLASGFDVLTAVFVIMLGAGSGTLAATLDPFKIAIAVDTSIKAGIQNISNSSGMAWRVISWIVISGVFQFLVIWRAIKIRKNPQKSTLFHRKKFFDEKYKINSVDIPLTRKRKAVLWIFIITFLLMIFGLISWHKFGVTIFGKFNNSVTSNAPYFSTIFAKIGDWYMVELSTLFFIASIVIGALNWKGSDTFVKDYIDGSKNLLSVGLIIALSGGVGIILQNSGMGPIIVKALTNSLGTLHPILFIVILFFIFLVISFLIPSSSALAKAAFPIVGPVAQNIGMLSMSIMAYSFASGFINLISPTSGYFMAILMLTNIKWGEYVKAVWPMMAIVMLVTIIFLVIGTQLPTSIA